MKIGYINGVNTLENQEFLATLRYAYAQGSAGSRNSRLEITIVDPGFAEIFRLIREQGKNIGDSMDPIIDLTRQAIQGLDAEEGVEAIVVPYGAQRFFPEDYILEGITCRVFYVMYQYMRRRLKNIIKEDNLCHNIEQAMAKAGFFIKAKEKRSRQLSSLGVIGLSRPAESFASSNYLEEHLEAVSYSLVTPIDRMQTWQHFDQAFYGLTLVSETVFEAYCHEVLIEMQGMYEQNYDRKGLKGVIVTDFWTEQYLATAPIGHHQLTGEIQLPNGTTLPLLNLERVEAWAIADHLSRQSKTLLES